MTEAEIRQDERARIVALIDTHISHLYPLTFANSMTGEVERGKQLPTHVARLEPIDIEALDQLDFIKKQIKQMGE